MGEVIMIDIVTALSTNLFRTFLIERFMLIFFEEKKTKVMRLLVYSAFYVITSTVYLLFQFPPFTITVNLVLLYLITQLYDSDQKRKILVTFLVYAVNMVCDILSVYMLSNYTIGETYNEISPYFTVILIFICEYIAERCILNKKEEKNTPPNWHILLLIPLVSIVMLFYLLIQNFYKRGLLVVLSIGILIINILVFYLYSVLSDSYIKLQENFIYEKQINSYSNQLDVLMRTDRQIRALRHDMKHHLIELIALAKGNTNCKEIENYILNMQDFMENPYEYVNTNNKEFDSIFNYMLQKAKKVLKDVDFKIKVPEDLDVNSFDLNVILGNLLDNAIYAAEKSNEKKLSVMINYNKGMLFIDIQNSFNHILHRKEGTLLTTKEDFKNHGIGLQNVKKIVEKYNGTVVVSDENNVFHVNIMMYALKLKNE